jgi:polygalacturonase
MYAFAKAVNKGYINQQNVAVTGEGLIHGKGKIFWDKYRNMRKEYDPKGLRWIVDYDCERPRGVLISNSKDVTVKDIVLYQSGFWSLHILYSEQVTVDNIIISNNIEGRGPSTDGIDIDSSRKILIENSHINCNDDNFCLKAGRDADGLRVNRPTEYVVIRNCIAGHGDGLFTCGSETSGSIRNIVAYNLKGVGTKYGLRFKSTMQRGGTVENIYLCNIEMQGVKNPFVVDLNWLPAYNANLLPEGYDYDTIPDHWKKLLTTVTAQRGTPRFENIYFENIKATAAETCINAVGIETSLLTNFCFKNVNLEGEKAGVIRFAEKWQTKGLSLKTKDRKLKTENVKEIAISLL